MPHTGDQADRFKPAMEERNRWIVLNGQPDAVQHACDLCMRVFLLPDGTLSASQFILQPLKAMVQFAFLVKCQAIVGDGLSMGQPC